MSPWSWELQAARAGVLRLAHELAGVQQRLRAQEKLQEDGHGPMVMALHPAHQTLERGSNRSLRFGVHLVFITVHLVSVYPHGARTVC